MQKLTSNELDFKDAPRDPISCELLDRKSVTLSMLRLDLIHPYLQGNKWFKLRYNLQACQEQGFDQILSFGGAYSNHLFALAAAGAHLGLNTVGIIRGELVEPLNPVLAFCQARGMHLHPVSRQQYREKADPSFLHELVERFGNSYIVPEGGSNDLALLGCEEIATLACAQAQQPDAIIALACGTGTTMAGVLRGLQRRHAKHSVLGVSVLKAKGYIEGEVERWLGESASGAFPPWHVSDSFHCGGYAKSSMELTEFIENFKDISDIPLEPVYTGKLMLGLFSMIEADAFSPGTEIIALHTGGIIPSQRNS